MPTNQSADNSLQFGNSRAKTARAKSRDLVESGHVTRKHCTNLLVSAMRCENFSGKPAQVISSCQKLWS